MKSPLGDLGGAIDAINASNFQKEVLEAGNVVLDFYSTECPPCEALAPKFEALVNKKDEAESLTTLCEIQEPEDKWFAYFKQMGMKGVR